MIVSAEAPAQCETRAQLVEIADFTSAHFLIDRLGIEGDRAFRQTVHDDFAAAPTQKVIDPTLGQTDAPVGIDQTLFLSAERQHFTLLRDGVCRHYYFQLFPIYSNFFQIQAKKTKISEKKQKGCSTPGDHGGSQR